MSLRALALELYGLEIQVQELTRTLALAASDQRPALEMELLRTTAERNRLRAVLQAKKEPPFPGPR